MSAGALGAAFGLGAECPGCGRSMAEGEELMECEGCGRQVSAGCVEDVARPYVFPVYHDSPPDPVWVCCACRAEPPDW